MSLSELEFQALVQGYMECALWASTDQRDPSGGEPLDSNYDLMDIDLSTVERMEDDCRSFLYLNARRVEEAAEQNDYGYAGVGHDFWLTRNRHGAGFWDGDYEADLGDKLTEQAQGFGEFYLDLGDDDIIRGYGG